MINNERIHNLDYLRGIAAFGIMIYHYLSWSMGSFSAANFMGRVGIYGVSIFYVLSGLTLYYVYYEKMNLSKKDFFYFFKKRIFRIFPLLWLVTITAILLHNRDIDLTILFLNLSGLFGFVSWDKYFSTGVWSIGNELVFYAFFPFFILFIQKLKWLMILLSIILFGLYFYFAFIKLTPNLTLSEQWRNYVNPFNQIFLFLGGFLIGYFLHNIKVKTILVVTLLILALTLFTFYPATGDTINLVTGVNRIVFTLCCFLICFCFYKANFKFVWFVHQPLRLLGETSYSIYLIHPIVYEVTGMTNELYSESIRLIISICITLVLSYFTYEYFEKFFLKLGRQKFRYNKMFMLLKSKKLNN